MNLSTDEENKLVVHPGSWHKETPDWLMEEVKAERLIRGLAGLGGMMKDKEKKKAGIAETTLYLQTASMEAPLEKDFVEIYIWCGAKVYKKAKETDLPDMFREKLDEGLTENQERKLDELRRKIYRKRGGEISHPVIDAMKEVFLTNRDEDGEESEKQSSGTLDQFSVKA